MSAICCGAGDSIDLVEVPHLADDLPLPPLVDSWSANVVPHTASPNVPSRSDTGRSTDTDAECQLSTPGTCAVDPCGHTTPWFEGI